jgi:hypothetical protein
MLRKAIRGRWTNKTKRPTVRADAKTWDGMRGDVERGIRKIMEADGWDQESAARKLVEALDKRQNLASVVSQYTY